MIKMMNSEQVKLFNRLQQYYIEKAENGQMSQSDMPTAKQILKSPSYTDQFPDGPEDRRELNIGDIVYAPIPLNDDKEQDDPEISLYGMQSKTGNDDLIDDNLYRNKDLIAANLKPNSTSKMRPAMVVGGYQLDPSDKHGEIKIILAPIFTDREETSNMFGIDPMYNEQLGLKKYTNDFEYYHSNMSKHVYLASANDLQMMNYVGHAPIQLRKDFIRYAIPKQNRNIDRIVRQAADNMSHSRFNSQERKKLAEKNDPRKAEGLVPDLKQATQNKTVTPKLDDGPYFWSRQNPTELAQR